MSKKLKKKIYIWGTFDKNNYDLKNLVTGLKDIKYPFKIINCNSWNIKDKSQLKFRSFIKIILNIFCSYPRLILYYLKKVEKNQITLLGYPGWLDLLIIFPICKLKRNKLHLFLFISLYDTVVLDRKLVKNYFLKKTIYIIEKLILNLADKIIIDTNEHKKYLSNLYNIPKNKWIVSYTSIDKKFLRYNNKKKKYQILYFGKYIPLHGVKNILRIIKKCDKKLKWIFVGSGPDKKLLDHFKTKNKKIEIQIIEWLDYNDLKNLINSSKFILGIFGNSKKAHNVIPQKVYMALNSKSYVITRNTKAMLELNNKNVLKIDSVKHLPKLIMKYKKKNSSFKKTNNFTPHDKAMNYIKKINQW